MKYFVAIALICMAIIVALNLFSCNSTLKIEKLDWESKTQDVTGVLENER